MKNVLYGGDSTEPHEPNQDAIQQLTVEVVNQNVVSLLITNMAKLQFEAKKDAAAIFNNLLRRQVNGKLPVVEYIQRNPALLEALVQGYTHAEIALVCGTMLRDCVRHEALTRLILSADYFFNFFKFVEMANFDLASDAFLTFKDLLTQHKVLAAEFLEQNYDKIFTEYTTLLNSTNYVTKRQSLKLLGELLLERSNFNVMTRYISSHENLKLMMTLLRDKSRNIQFEAFHVFKVFVANPNKTPQVMDIFRKNKDRLITFLSNFQHDKDKDDDQFSEEKAFLLRQVQAIPTA